MSRSDYQDDLDNWDLIRWRGAVASAIRGKRGQQLLREMLVALDEMPEKSLIRYELELDGQYCALGVLGKSRGLLLSELDAEDAEDVAKAFCVSEALVREISFVNDESGWCSDPPEQLWKSMRAWVVSHLNKETYEN